MLAAGTRLGPYEIVAPLGAGGMGEVYQARDSRIGRSVAVKILPADLDADADRRRRFQQEAVAAGSLNHPNVLVVHDVGAEGERPYLVTELLRGRTLRAEIDRKPLPVDTAVRYAAAILDGLASAHGLGIVHRDLKPENVFITDDDVPKILDFGLARLPEALDSGGTMTAAGTVLGTVGYMAPEQVTGVAVDRRADLFSVAVVLYEMITGRAPFRRDTAIETLNAIVTAEITAPAAAPRWLRAIIERGLQKPPARRFQSAEDFAFALRLGDRDVPSARPAPRRVPIVVAGIVAALAIGGLAGSAWSRWRTPPVSSRVSYQRITFQDGRVWAARFVPGSDGIVYSASWNAEANQVFSTRAGFPVPTDLRLPPADLLGVSRNGELALLLGRRWLQGMEPSSGVLARAAGGGATREVAANVTAGDWTADADQLAAVRDLGRVRRLEFPLGHGVYETAGWIDFVRVSHDGSRVAFGDHPLRSDDRGDVVVVDRAGAVNRLARDHNAARGIAWSPDDREVWTALNGQVLAYDLHGGSRVVFRDPRQLVLADVAADGRAMIIVDQRRNGLAGRLAGDEGERDLTWFDYSIARDLTPDGRMLLFFEAGDVAGTEYIVAIRRAGDPGPVRIGDGHATSLSPDGRFALATMQVGAARFRILPTGVGETREVPIPSLAVLHWASWLPDGRRVLLSGNEPGHGAKLYVTDLGGRILKTIGPEGTLYQNNAVSPDGSRVAAQDPERRLTLYGIDDGSATVVAGVTPEERVIGWSADASEVFVLTPGLPSKVWRLNLSTGARTLWRDVLPPGVAGVVRVSPVLVTPDGRSYAYTFGRYLSTLYVVSGIR